MSNTFKPTRRHLRMRKQSPSALKAIVASGSLSAASAAAVILERTKAAKVKS